MKKKNSLAELICFSLALILLQSCGTYRYYQPTANPVLFQGKGEYHVSGEAGISGLSAKAAVSVTDNIAVIGQYNSGITTYRSKEGEVGVGYYKRADPKGYFLAGGLGFGSNFGFTDSTESIKSYEGTFYRPFIQFNHGVTGGKIIGGLRGDVVVIMKANYLFYEGRRLTGDYSSLNSNYANLETAVAVGLGSRVFRFELIYGFPIHITWFDQDKPRARTYPINLSVGFHFIFGRKKADK